MGHITEAFVRVALPHPQLHFTLRSGDRIVHDLPPVESWRERILTCFGAEVGESLIWIEGRDETIHLSGYVAEPNCSRANNRLQYLFLNGRHIRDRSLQHALGEAYRGLLMTGRFPVAFLRLQLPPEIVDVNVHPTKLEVRFQDSSRVYAQLLSTLRNKFLASDFTARVRPLSETLSTSSPYGASTSTGDPSNERQLFNWPVATAPVARDPFFSSPQHATPRNSEFVETHDQQPPSSTPLRPIMPARVDPGASVAASPISNRHRGMQVHNRYVVAESDEGLLVIDQHALHERILYERLREKVLSKELEVQRLLVPDVVTLTAAEAAAAIEHSPTLSRLGLEIEPFGGDAILIVAYPAMLANLNPTEVVLQAVARLMNADGRAEPRDLMDDLLHMMACKAAIKAGDRLSLEEVETLLENRHLCRDAHHCPHGRPTALVFTREELDKRFKRI
jgi:DNA mismatch repair protein MutL